MEPRALEISGVERIELLRVPLDVLPPDRIESAVSTLIESGRSCHIVLLSIWDLLKARRSGEYRSYVLKADLVLPISKSLIGGARFLRKAVPFRYMPFDFSIKLLSALEPRNRSIYLLGARRKSLQTAERNLRHTFPGVRIVGRYAGYWNPRSESDIVTAIAKATPSLLLVGEGVPGEERWIARNTGKLGPGIRMWCSDLFDIYAERKRRPSRAVFEKGLEGFGQCVRAPWRVFRLLPYSYYKLLLLIDRIFRRG